jgi:uncharacterized protein YjbJ (UPF0337 family)
VIFGGSVQCRAQPAPTDELPFGPELPPQEAFMEPRQQSTSAGTVADQARHAVAEVAGQAKEQASNLADQARSRAEGVMQQRQSDAGRRVEQVAGALLQAAHKLDEEGQSSLSGYATRAASSLERAGRYVRESSPRDVLRDADAFARRNPAAIIAGAFVAGLLLARFVKSSSPATGSAVFDRDFAEMPVEG